MFNGLELDNRRTSDYYNHLYFHNYLNTFNTITNKYEKINFDKIVKINIIRSSDICIKNLDGQKIISFGGEIPKEEMINSEYSIDHEKDIYTYTLSDYYYHQPGLRYYTCDKCSKEPINELYWRKAQLCSLFFKKINDLWIFNFVLNDWINLTPFLKGDKLLPRSKSAIVADGNRVWIYGGFDNNCTCTNDLYMCDIKDRYCKKFETSTPLPTSCASEMILVDRTLINMFGIESLHIEDDRDIIYKYNMGIQHIDISNFNLTEY